MLLWSISTQLCCFDLGHRSEIMMAGHRSKIMMATHNGWVTIVRSDRQIMEITFVREQTQSEYLTLSKFIWVDCENYILCSIRHKDFVWVAWIDRLDHANRLLCLYACVSLWPLDVRLSNVCDRATAHDCCIRVWYCGTQVVLYEMMKFWVEFYVKFLYCFSKMYLNIG